MEVEGTEDISLNMEPLSDPEAPSANLLGLNNNLKHRIAADFMAILSGAIEEKCFVKCVSKPGIRMERSEERCLRQCMERFMEAWNISSQTVQRIGAKIGSTNNSHNSGSGFSIDE